MAQVQKPTGQLCSYQMTVFPATRARSATIYLQISYKQISSLSTDGNLYAILHCIGHFGVSHKQGSATQHQQSQTSGVGQNI